MSEVKLSLKIENKSPVELNQLTLSLNALALQYDSFLRKSDNFNYPKNERKLYISKLEQGSVLIDLIPAVTPLMQEINSIIEFGTYLKYTFEYFLGKNNDNKYNHTKQDCEQINELLSQTAQDNGSNININVVGSNNTIIAAPVININSIEANAIQNAIRKQLEKEIIEKPMVFYKELMYWANAKFVKNKHTKYDGKIIIKKIDSKPKDVIFMNENEKQQCMSKKAKFPNTEWNDLLYHVDVEVSYVEDIIKEYKILKVYEEVSELEDYFG